MKTNTQMLPYWAQNNGLDAALEEYYFREENPDPILERAIDNYQMARDFLMMKIAELDK